MPVVSLRQFWSMYALAPVATRAILSVDVGSHKCGLALARTVSPSSAVGLGVLRARPSELNVVVPAHLKRLAIEHHIMGFVLGWPRDPQKQVANAECRRVTALAQSLHAAQCFLPIVLWDETGTSVDARASLRGPRQRASGGAPEHAWKVDMLAAEALLDSFLRALNAQAATANGP